jgi:hypothetical protein
MAEKIKACFSYVDNYFSKREDISQYGRFFASVNNDCFSYG